MLLPRLLMCVPENEAVLLRITMRLSTVYRLILKKTIVKHDPLGTSGFIPVRAAFKETASLNRSLLLHVWVHLYERSLLCNFSSCSLSFIVRCPPPPFFLNTICSGWKIDYK